MNALTILLLLGSLLISVATSDPKRNIKSQDCNGACTIHQYCRNHDNDCVSCSDVCGDEHKDRRECDTYCKEYMLLQQFVSQKQYEGESRTLWILSAISMSVALISLLTSFYLLSQRFGRWKKVRSSIRRAFTANRTNKTQNCNNNNETQADPELGATKHNGLRLAMPTISATVAPARHSENGSAGGSGSGSGSGTGNATPNTTTTSLSRRHPSEDTTLDYAYDNPAMTPSPETVQLRTKRESSF